MMQKKGIEERRKLKIRAKGKMMIWLKLMKLIFEWLLRINELMSKNLDYLKKLEQNKAWYCNTKQKLAQDSEVLTKKERTFWG